MARRKINLPVPGQPAVSDAATGTGITKESLPLICQRIRFYREKSGLEQKAFAARLGVTANAASNWECGRSRPDVNLLPSICRTLGITLYDLFAEAPPAGALSVRENNLIEGYRALDPANRYVIDRTVDTLRYVQKAGRCPEIRRLLYFEKSLAAGTGDPTEFEQDASEIYLYASPEINRADYLFTVNGDSMEPEYHTGDLVLVQRLSASSAMHYGEIGAFIAANELYIKEYREDGLHSLNKKYPVLRFNEEEPVYLIGRVLGIASNSDIAPEEEVQAILSISGAAV